MLLAHTYESYRDYFAPVSVVIGIRIRAAMEANALKVLWNYLIYGVSTMKEQPLGRDTRPSLVVRYISIPWDKYDSRTPGT